MPSVIQTNFTAGEFSPLMAGRTDLAKYQNACRTLANMIVLPQGGATRRSAFRFVALPKYANKKHRLLRFLFGDNQAYIIEAGDLYARFFTNEGQIIDGGSPVEIVTPWPEADLGALGFAQSADVLYVLHGKYKPRELQRVSNTNWQLALFAFKDGPYLKIPDTDTTLTPSAAAASVTLTASATDDINSGQGFLATDIDREIRLRQKTYRLSSIPSIAAGGGTYQLGERVTLDGGDPVIDSDGITKRRAIVEVTQISSGVVQRVAIVDYGSYLSPPSSPASQLETTGSGSGLQIDVGFTRDGAVRWNWGTITARTSPTIVDVEMDEALISTDAVEVWRLGAWSDTTQWPVAAALFQERLYFGGADGTIWASESADYPSFSPSEPNGQVIDSNALTFTLDDTEVNTVAWLSPAGAAQIPQLGVGTAGAEHITSNGGAAITPTAVQAYPETRYGSKPSVKALRVGKAVLFLQRGGQQLREWIFQYQVGGYIAEPPLEILSEHLLLPGIAQMDYAQQPYSLVWAYREDGGLIGLTYLRGEDVVGWHRHRLGGNYYAAPPLVESLAVIPAPDRLYDQLWLSGLRTINGAAVRTIELQTRPFRDMPLEQAVFMDCAISSALTYPAATCTLGGSGLPEQGDSLAVSFSAGIAASGDVGTYLRINGGLLRVSGYSDATHVTAVVLQPPLSLAPAASGAWSYTAPKTVFTGLDLLEGEEVAILGDGAVYPRQTVAGGKITLPYPASYVTVGLPYDSELETLSLELPEPDGTSQGKTARADHLYLRLFETLGGDYGPQKNITDKLRPRSTADPLGAPPPLFTGDERLAFPGGFNADHRVYARQSDPLPLTILAVVAKARGYERGGS